MLEVIKEKVLGTKVVIRAKRYRSIQAHGSAIHRLRLLDATTLLLTFIVSIHTVKEGN